MTGMTDSGTAKKSDNRNEQLALMVNHFQERAAALQAERLAPVKEFRIVFCGVFSSGKTSLINALLHLKLPTGINPITKMITKIRYGSRLKVMFEADGGKGEIRFDSAREIISGKIKPPQGKNAAIVIETPSQLLKSGVTFIDTPGIEDTDKGMDALTMSALKEAQLTIMCFNPTVLCDMTEKQLLETIQELTGGNCVFVLNCMNYLNTSDDVREVEERANRIFKNYGNVATVGKGKYFKICSSPEKTNLDGFDKWLEYVITYRREKIEDISLQASFAFKAKSLCNEIRLAVSELEAVLKDTETANQESILCRAEVYNQKTNLLKQIEKNHIAEIADISKKVYTAIDGLAPVQFVEETENAINKYARAYVGKLFRVLCGNAFKAADYNVDKNFYMAMAAETAKQVNVQAPEETRHTYSWYDRISNGIFHAFNGIDPIINDMKYYYTYNDFRAKAKENFGLFGVPFLREIHEAVIDDYVSFLETEKENPIGEYDEEIKYIKYNIVKLRELQNNIKKEFALQEEM